MHMKKGQGYFVLICSVNNIIYLLTPLDKRPKKLYKRVCFSVYPGDNNVEPRRSSCQTRLLIRRVPLPGVDASPSLLGGSGQDWGNSLVCRHLEPSVDRIGELLSPGLEMHDSGSLDRLEFSPPVCSTQAAHQQQQISHSAQMACTQSGFAYSLFMPEKTAP